LFYSFYRVYDAVDSGFLAYVIPGGIVRVVAGVLQTLSVGGHDLKHFELGESLFFSFLLALCFFSA